MRKSAKIITALSVAGLAVAAGSAFTATSEIDDAAKHVGTIGQSITGLHVESVVYTIGANDTTTGVAFHVTEELDAAFDTVAATIANTVPASSSDVDCDLNETVAGTDVTCTFTGIVNVTSLTIVAS